MINLKFIFLFYYKVQFYIYFFYIYNCIYKASQEFIPVLTVNSVKRCIQEEVCFKLVYAVLQTTTKRGTRTAHITVTCRCCTTHRVMCFRSRLISTFPETNTHMWTAYVFKHYDVLSVTKQLFLTVAATPPLQTQGRIIRGKMILFSLARARDRLMRNWFF